MKVFYRKLSGLMSKRPSDDIYRNNYKKQKLDTYENKVEYVPYITPEVIHVKSEVNNIKLELSTLETNINKSIIKLESILNKFVK